MDGMSRFEPDASARSTYPAEHRETVRSAMLLTVVAVVLTLSIVNGARMLAEPVATDAILYAPIGW